jgi:hypothetical protein
MERLAADPHYFAKPDRALFQDIRRYFPITVQAQVAWAVTHGVEAAVEFIEEQIESGAFERGNRALPCDHPQGQALPAHAAAGARLLPVPPASRALARRGLTRAISAREPPVRAISSVRPVSHDTDKLIRQLSLVAFLMAERRPLTARDIKAQRRGLPGDERRGLRAPLLLRPRRARRPRRPARLPARRVHRRGALHAPLRALLPAAARPRRRRARGAADLPLPARGRFAYAEPLRLALQNLALGRLRGVLDDGPTATAVRVEVSDPDYTPELQGRLGKLEGGDLQAAHGPRFDYWSIAPRRGPANGRSTPTRCCPRTAPGT